MRERIKRGLMRGLSDIMEMIASVVCPNHRSNEHVQHKMRENKIDKNC